MFQWLGRWIERIVAICGALIFFQGPVFIQQYSQQLIGRIDELQWQVELLKASAEQSQKTVAQYIEKFSSNADPDIARQGSVMDNVVQRYEYFSMTQARLNEANMFTRPLVFLHYVDLGVAKSTYKNFQAGVPFSVEALLYAFAGLVISYGLLFALLRLIALPYRLIKHKKAPPQ